MITPAQLVELADETVRAYPEAELHKNQVGNLTVLVDGEYVAWLDLRTGELNDVQVIPDDEDDPPPATGGGIGATVRIDETDVPG